MSRQILVSHLEEESLRRPFLVSLLGHIGLFFAVVVGANFCGPTLIEIGSGEGGGQGGEVITVGLSDELSGGAGMVKPSIVPQPQALPPEPEVEEAPVEQEPEPPVAEDVFDQVEIKQPEPETPEEEPPPLRRPEKETPTFPPAAGVIRQEPDPGSGGPAGGGSGSGGGFGGGVGVSIGSGTGGRGMDSWYVRQVERRIGENWLRTSMGDLRFKVRTTVSFEITRDGNIENIQIDSSSGMRSVDLAAERAVRASSPLPPLPLELRRRNVRFVAHFEYPPR